MPFRRWIDRKQKGAEERAQDEAAKTQGGHPKAGVGDLNGGAGIKEVSGAWAVVVEAVSEAARKVNQRHAKGVDQG